jgi:glycosyltransferase involved in cell wall biosynthesis
MTDAIVRAAIYCDCDSRGGVATYSMRMSRIFKSFGWQVILVTDQPRNAHEAGIASDLGGDCGEVIFLERGMAPDPRITAIERIIHSREIDVFIPNYRRLAYAAAVKASQRRKLKIIGVCHSDHQSYYHVLTRYRTATHCFVCASRKTLRTLGDLIEPAYQSKLKYIPHYVDWPESGRASYRQDEFTVIYHGRLQEEQKATSEIIRVAKIACERSPHIRFKLIGEISDPERYRGMIEGAGLTGRVEISGAQPWAGVTRELLQAQAAILTSRHEGFCYSVAESLCAGLPVVAYDCGEVINDFITPGKNGYIVPWGDAPGLADRILQLHADRSLWEQLSEGACSSAQDLFGFEAAASRYKMALEEDTKPGVTWPRLRPYYVPVAGRSFRSLVEKAGQWLGAWR